MTSVRPRADAERDGTLFVYDLGDGPQPPSVRGATLRAATADDATALQEAMDASGVYGAETVVTRLGEGRRPYVLATGGIIVAYGWVAFTPEPVGDLGFSFRVGPDEAYIYDCATRPSYRGRGYYPALLRYILADLRSGPYRRVWIATAPGNVPSQHGIIRAGFTKVADVRITHKLDGSVGAELYGVPGIPLDVLEHGAWAFHGHPYPQAGLPAVRLSER